MHPDAANHAGVNKVFVFRTGDCEHPDMANCPGLIKYLFRTGDCEHQDKANRTGLIKYLCSGLVTASTLTWLTAQD